MQFILCLFLVPLARAIPVSGRASPGTSLNNATQPQFARFVPDPDGRGTVSLVISCLLTLLLCVWQALHLNVPKRGETAWEKFMTNIVWITVGIYAPELVVFTAWRQWSSAKLLGTIVKEHEHRSEQSTDTEHTQASPPFEEERDVCIEEIKRVETKAKRRHEWTKVHSFFASTGGFAFEIDDRFDEHGKPTTPYLPSECPRRLTLTARGVALLAQCGLLPDIPEEEIQDKSKANNMAKALVVLQASWMLVQVVGRLASRLPVTLLEVNTVAHVLCAFLMYAMWWNKPLLPEEPVVLRGPWVDNLCAYMFMSSEISGRVDKPTVASRSVVKRLFASLKVYSKVPEIERLRLQIPKDERTPSVAKDIKGNSAPLLRHQSDFSPAFSLSSRRSLENLRSIRDSAKSRETAFFERRPRITAPERATTLATPVHLRRWELAAEAIGSFPVLHSPQYVLYSHFLADCTCIHSAPVELVRPYVQNWPYDDLLRNVGGLTVGMILWLSNFIYGGLHASAWKDHFPSVAEKWFWRASCSYISFAGGLWIILNWVAAAYPPLNDFWERWMDGGKGKIWSILLGFIVAVCGISFGLARVYLVLEAFLSIRELPLGAYDTPNWSQLVPHF